MFDLDGTVADTCADLAGAVNHVRAEHGLAALPVATVTSLLGNGLKDLTTRTFTDAPPIDVDAVTERVKNYYWSHVVDETCLYDGVLETLAHLKAAGYKLAVITNKPEGPAKTIMDGLGVSPYLDYRSVQVHIALGNFHETSNLTNLITVTIDIRDGGVQAFIQLY